MKVTHNPYMIRAVEHFAKVKSEIQDKIKHYFFMSEEQLTKWLDSLEFDKRLQHSYITGDVAFDVALFNTTALPDFLVFDIILSGGSYKAKRFVWGLKTTEKRLTHRKLKGYEFVSAEVLAIMGIDLTHWAST